MNFQRGKPVAEMKATLDEIDVSINMVEIKMIDFEDSSVNPERKKKN